nr:hypothetical protein [uncultured Anaerosporobacter sp.]
MASVAAKPPTYGLINAITCGGSHIEITTATVTVAIYHGNTLETLQVAPSISHLFE